MIVYDNSKVNDHSPDGEILLWHCWRSSATGCISIISVYDLARLVTSNVDRSYKRKWLFTNTQRCRQYPAETITGTDYTDNIARLANTPTQTESVLYKLEYAAGGICFRVNGDKLAYMCFILEGTISTLNIPQKTIAGTDNADNIARLANTPTQPESVLYKLEYAAGGICFRVNGDKVACMCFILEGTISTLNEISGHTHIPEHQRLIKWKW